jgi:hypothetical protein
MRYGIGSYMPFGIQSYITELNDTYEWSFEDMADLLEDCIAGDCWWPVIYEFDGHLMYEESVEHRPNYLC